MPTLEKELEIMGIVVAAIEEACERGCRRLGPPRGIIDELRAAGLEIRRIDDEAIPIRNPGVAETRYAMVKGRARQRGGAFSCLSGPERTALI
jgi:hypothetical protein